MLRPNYNSHYRERHFAPQNPQSFDQGIFYMREAFHPEYSSGPGNSYFSEPRYRIPVVNRFEVLGN